MGGAVCVQTKDSVVPGECVPDWGGVAHVCACVCGCMYPSTPTLAFPGTGISKKFLESLNQEVWRLEWAKTVASGALLPETLSCLCGKGAVLGVCVCECVSTKCVDSHVQSSYLCSSKCVQLRLCLSAQACGFPARGTVVQMYAPR